jgi:hypothetical protein
MPMSKKARKRATKAAKNPKTLPGLLPNISMVNMKKKKAKMRNRCKKG